MNKDWRDDLLPASFRGVTGHVTDSGLGGKLGRRIAKHEYPLREGAPNVDDMGPVGEEFPVEFFYVGDDVKAWREEMRIAINTPGPGKLVHPRLGEMMVQIGDARWRYKGNKESVVMTFHQAAPESPTTQTTDTAVTLSDSAASCLAAAEQLGGDVLEQAADEGFSLETIIDTVQNAGDTLRQINGRIDAALQPVQDAAQAIDALGNEINELISQPRSAIAAIAGAVSEVLGLSNDISSALDGYKNLGALWGSVDDTGTYPVTSNWNYQEPLPLTTPQRVREATYNTAVRDVVRVAALATTMTVLADNSEAIGIADNAASPFDSANQAYAMRDELLAQIDAIALNLSIDSATLYTRLMDMQAALVAHIEAHGNTLPRVNSVSFNNTLPALVIAHQLYGDANRADDLISRNNLSAPLFVDAGTSLEVLNA
jgi:prophage DNA circulation protein